MRRTIVLFAFLTLFSPAWGQSPPNQRPSFGSPWPMDVIRLRNGATLKGLILDSDDHSIRMQCVLREPGRPTVTFRTTITRAEVDRIERLNPTQRMELQTKLRQLDECTGDSERCRMASLVLRPTGWNGSESGAWQYDSDFFSLISDAHEEIVRRAALRLEQIYAAYSRFLPPRHKGGLPTKVLLLSDTPTGLGRPMPGSQPIRHPAYFEPAANRIVSHCDLQEWGERLEAIRAEHRKLRAELEVKQAEFARLYKGRDLHRVSEPIERTRAALASAEIKNNQMFAAATRLLFAQLYHEAFHAYLANFVYPARGPQPPRWLNEGLAQIFETAILEGCELRVGHADPVRLERASKAAPRGELVPLADLLRSNAKHFLVAHDSDRLVSDRYYLTSWALAFHLSFERRLLGTPELDRFIQRCHAGHDPIEAFEQLLGTPLSEFESAFHRYLIFLQPDGSVLRVMP